MATLIPGDNTSVTGFLSAGELVPNAAVEVLCERRGFDEWAAATVLQFMPGDASPCKLDDAGERLQDAWVCVQLLSGTEVDVEYLCCRRRRSYPPAVPPRGTNGMLKPSRDLPPYHPRAPRNVGAGKLKRI